MRCIHIIILLIMSLVFNSCTPHLFNLNIFTDRNELSCAIISPYGTVEKLSKNSFQLNNNALMAIKLFDVTQNHIDYSVRLQSGTGFKFAFRTASYKHAEHDKILIDFSTEGFKIYENEILLLNLVDYRASLNTDSRFRILNDGKVFKVFIDCDEVYSNSTELAGTEQVIFETNSESKVLVFGINIDNIQEATDEEDSGLW